AETVEMAAALVRLMRVGLGAHAAVLPEETSDALDAFRLPLSAIRDAQVVVVLGDEAVVERAPVVDLWIRAARRNGAEIITIGASGATQAVPGGALAEARKLKRRLADVDRVILIWSGSGGHG